MRTVDIPVKHLREGDVLKGGAIVRSIVPRHDETYSVRTQYGEWRWAGDSVCIVRDPSGLRELQYEVETFGPYVTSCTMDRERSGHVHFTNVRASGPSVVLCDLLIHMSDGREVRLDHVELGHLSSMATKLSKEARS